MAEVSTGSFMGFSLLVYGAAAAADDATRTPSNRRHLKVPS
jgi:hypothetical protein